MSKPLSAVEEAERAGFDMSLIDANLSYSYEQRVLHHDEALHLILEFERAGYQVDEQHVVRMLALRRLKRAKA